MLNREEFDPDREFVTTKAALIGGVTYAPGQNFPKHVCSARKLRQLYEQTLLSMTEPRSVYRSPTARFDAMTLDELRSWLSNHGMVARITWDRAKLLEKAAALETVA